MNQKTIKTSTVYKVDINQDGVEYPFSFTREELIDLRDQLNSMIDPYNKIVNTIGNNPYSQKDLKDVEAFHRRVEMLRENYGDHLIPFSFTRL